MYSKIAKILKTNKFADKNEAFSCFLKIHFQTIDFIANDFDIIPNGLLLENDTFILWSDTYYKLLLHVAIQSGNSFLLSVINNINLSEFNDKGVINIIDSMIELLSETEMNNLLIFSNYYYQRFEPLTENFYFNIDFSNKLLEQIEGLKTTELLSYIISVFKDEGITPSFILIEKLYRLTLIPCKSRTFSQSVNKILGNMFGDINEQIVEDIILLTKDYIRKSDYILNSKECFV